MVARTDYDADDALTIERAEELVARDIVMPPRRFDLFGDGEWSSAVASWTTVKSASLLIMPWMEEAHLWWYPYWKRTAGTSGSVRLSISGRSGNSATFTVTSYPTDPADAVSIPLSGETSGESVTVDIQLFATGGSTAFVNNDDLVSCEFSNASAQ